MRPCRFVLPAALGIGVTALHMALALLLGWMVRTSMTPLPDVTTVTSWLNFSRHLRLEQWYEHSRSAEMEALAPFHAMLLPLLHHHSTIQEQPTALLSVVMCVALGLPASWLWCRKVATLLLADREESTNGGDTQLCLRMTLVGTVTMCLVLLPTIVEEAVSLRPVALGSALCVWAFFFLLQDETALNPSRQSRATSDGFHAEDEAQFDLSRPIVRQGAIVCFPMRHVSRQRHLVVLWLLWCVICTMVPHFTFLLPAVTIWVVSACYQRCFRRVLVMAEMPPTTVVLEEQQQQHQQPKKRGAMGTTKHVGLSCYTDLTLMWWALMKLILVVVAVAMAAVLPFCSSWTSAAGLLYALLPPSFATVKLEFSASSSSSSSSSSLPPLSIASGADWLDTGNQNATSRTLSRTAAPLLCLSPSGNIWCATEYFGAVPWTDVFRAVVSFFTTLDGEEAVNATAVLFSNVIIFCVTLLHAIPLLALLVYRFRKPPLAFDSPIEQQCAIERERQRVAMARGKSWGRDAAGCNRQAATITCISRGEYVVKQAVLCCEFVVFSGITVFLFSGQRDHRGLSQFTVLMAPSGCLASVAAMAAFLRRVHTDAFEGINAALSQLRQGARGLYSVGWGDAWAFAALPMATLILLAACMLPYTKGATSVVLQISCNLLNTAVVVLPLVVIVIAVTRWCGTWPHLASALFVCIVAAYGGGFIEVREADRSDAMRGGVCATLLFFLAGVHAAARVVALSIEAENAVVLVMDGAGDSSWSIKTAKL